MSIAAPPKSNSPEPPPAGGAVSQADQLIEQRIAEACRALWWAELTRSVLRAVIAIIVLMLVWVIVDQWVYSPGVLVRTLLFVASVSALGGYGWFRVRPLLGSSIRPEYAARSLESDMPDLRQSLTSYVTLRGDRASGGLRSRVVRSIAAQTAGRLRAQDELPQEATGTLRWWLVTAAAFAVLVAYTVVSPKNSFKSAARIAAPLASIEPARRVSIKDVQPGNVEAIAGRALEVSANIDGIRDDERVLCRWELPSGQEAGTRETVLTRDSKSGRFAGQVDLPHAASGQVPYVISAGDAEAGPFYLTVQDLPVVALQSVTYEPPAYTGQPRHTSSSGAITALDGTRVQILARTNRPVKKAKIEFNPRKLGDTVQATAGATDIQIDASGTTLSVSFSLRSARGRSAAVEPESYRIQVSDAAGQTNPDPIVYPIRVVTDLPPEVAIMLPVTSPKDLPIDLQQTIEVHASDPDFGLRQVTLEIRSGIDLIAEPVLWSVENANADQSRDRRSTNQIMEYGFRPAALGLRIGDTVQIVAVATDNRTIEHMPSIEPNVVRTDPVEIRIVSMEEDPRSQDSNPDGVGQPDQKPEQKSSDEAGEQSGKDGESGQQSGGGSSGESGSSSKGSGGDQSGSSSQQEGESDGEETGEKGTSSSGGSSQDSAEGDPSQSNDGSGSNEMSDNSSGEPSDTNAASDPSNDSGQSGRPSDAKAGQDSSDGDPSGDADSSSASEGQQPEGQMGDPSNSSSKTEGESSGEAGAENRDGQRGDPNGANSKQQSGTGENAAGDPSGSEAGEEPAEEQGSPKHDGETFERIRDFLEKKQQEQEQSGGSNSQQGEQGSPDNQGDQGASGNQQGEQSGDANSQDSPSKDPSGASSDSSGSDRKNASSDSSDSPSEDQSDGQPSEEQGKTPDNQGKPSDKQGQPGDDEGKPSGEQGDQGDEGEAGQNGEQGDPAEESGSGDQPSSDSEQQGSDSEGQNDSEAGQQNPSDSDQQSKSDSPSGTKGSGKPGSEASPNQTPNAKSDNKQSPHQTTADTFDGSGQGGDVGDPADAVQAPDPVDLEYAKQATDMVLDYLKETRDAPDRELLDQLNWTEDDLKQFAQRWQNVRDVSNNDPSLEGDGELSDALRSLGLRPSVTDSNQKVRESADSLRSVRDSGNRKPPPAAYRDAFDSFRRAIGKQ
ncbi:MAG: circumsporozoite protein- membrane associated protein [Rubripirellula sp.]